MSASSTDEKVGEALKPVRTLIEEIVRHKQLRDVRTGLPNEAALSVEIEEALESKRQFWCAFIEIDHFKRLNDSFGYQKAGAMLKKVGEHSLLASPRPDLCVCSTAVLVETCAADGAVTQRKRCCSAAFLRSRR